MVDLHRNIFFEQTFFYYEMYMFGIFGKSLRIFKYFKYSLRLFRINLIAFYYKQLIQILSDKILSSCVEKKVILKNQLNWTETKHYIDRCIFIFNSDKVFLLSIRETLQKTVHVLFHWSNAYRPWFIFCMCVYV